MQPDESACQLSRKADDCLRILVIEPRQLYQECLAKYLNGISGVEAVSVACQNDWIELAAERPVPDVILHCIAGDERMPVEAVEVLPSVDPLRSVPTVILSNERQPSHVLDLLKGGIKGFIPTSFACEVAVQVIRLVKAGGIFVPPNCLGALDNHDLVSRERDKLFTHRQKQVIEALRMGKPNKIIAYELNMCESTVKVHVRTIMKKLQARNRTEIAYLYSSSQGNGDPKQRGLELTSS